MFHLCLRHITIKTLSNHLNNFQLKELTLKYYNCDNNTWVRHLSNFIEFKNSYQELFETKYDNKCEMRKIKKDFDKMSIINMPSVVPNLFYNNSENSDQDVCDVEDLNMKYFNRESQVCFSHTTKVKSVLLNTMKHSHK